MHNDCYIYSSKKVTHILVYRQVQIIVAVTCVLNIRCDIEGFFCRFHAFEEKKNRKNRKFKNWEIFIFCTFFKNV